MILFNYQQSILKGEWKVEKIIVWSSNIWLRLKRWRRLLQIQAANCQRMRQMRK